VPKICIQLAILMHANQYDSPGRTSYPFIVAQIG